MQNERKFYSNFASFGCPHCGCHIQRLTFNEQGEPIDIDWEAIPVVYNNHFSNCSVENPWTNDPDVYYGDKEACYPSVSGACPY